MMQRLAAQYFDRAWPRVEAVIRAALVKVAAGADIDAELGTIKARLRSEISKGGRR